MVFPHQYRAHYGQWRGEGGICGEGKDIHACCSPNGKTQSKITKYKKLGASSKHKALNVKLHRCFLARFFLLKIYPQFGYITQNLT